MLALIVSDWPEGPLGVGIAFGLAAVLGALVGAKLWRRSGTQPAAGG